jgi:hypothetical protein
MKALLGMVLGALLLSGCASLSGVPESFGAKLAVQQGTMRVIGDDVPRAERVVNLTREIGSYMEHELVTVEVVDTYLRSQIEWEMLDLADAQLLVMLLDELRFQLDERLGSGVLAVDDKLVIATVLDWVSDAASLVILMRG